MTKPHASNLDKIKHIIVIMMENRSFDHMLGFLYADNGNRSPNGDDFEGLTGDEFNHDDSTGKDIKVFKIQSNDPYRYVMPKADPGEGYGNTMSQLYSSSKVTKGPFNKGFVNDWAFAYVNIDEKYFKEKDGVPPAYPGINNRDIMGMFTPELLPVMSGLAKGFAVCDHWYCSVPTETIPNRAFIHMATSQGVLKDTLEKKEKDGETKRYKFEYTAPSIYPKLSEKDVSWSIYGYKCPPLVRSSTKDLQEAANSHFGVYEDFKKAIQDKTLPEYVFLEPDWGVTGNSMHPNYNVAKGEEFLLDLYNTIRHSDYWEDTLLIINFDEHGGCYDHVLPPDNAAQPNEEAYNSEEDFDFTRFGVRVPAILVSPWIPAGSVFRVPEGSTPIDHTSVLATLEEKYGIDPLTARDAAAPHLGGALSLDEARKDDPMKDVKAPEYTPPKVPKGADRPGHIQTMHKGYLNQLHESKNGRSEINDSAWLYTKSKDANEHICRSYHKYYHHDEY